MLHLLSLLLFNSLLILSACSPLPVQPAPAPSKSTITPTARPAPSVSPAASARPDTASPTATASASVPLTEALPVSLPGRQLQSFLEQVYQLELLYPDLLVPYPGNASGIQLRVRLLNRAGQELSDWPEDLQQHLHYSSSQPKVMHIDTQGRLQPLQASGHSRIRVSLQHSNLSAEHIFVISAQHSSGGGGGGGGGASNGNNTPPPEQESTEKIVGNIAFQF